MKTFSQVFGWYFNRITKFFGNIPSFFIRLFLPIRKGTVMCWSYDFKQFSCNPRYMTDYILENNPEFKVYWVFKKNISTSNVDSRVKCIRFHSWEYYIVANTAEFLITNCRTDPYRYYWKKRQGQKYIMTWHGGVALKQVEKDAEDKLGYSYLRKAKTDSKVCDLMISGARIQTRLLSEKFWYNGEILEKGTPRCDIFFRDDIHSSIKAKVMDIYKIPSDARIVLYAPTFRRSKSIEPYRIDWKEVIDALKQFYACTEVKVLLRLHPNLMKKVDTAPLLNSPDVIDATSYHDMQELMCISDMLISDYSSSMFDFTLLGRPCILYATDLKEYERGYYFNFQDLPFPLAESQDELVSCIRAFDLEKYQEDVRRFNSEDIGMVEDGNASRSLMEWMKEHSI